MAITPIPVRPHEPKKHKRLETYIRRSSAQSITNDTDTFLIWQVESLDDEGFFDPGTPDRISFLDLEPSPSGIFLFTTRVAFAAGVTGYREVCLADPLTGAVIAATRRPATATLGSILTLETVCNVEGSGIVELGVRVRHTQGAALNVEAGGSNVINETSLRATRLGRGSA